MFRHRRPVPMPPEPTWQEAESAAAEHMRDLGFLDAKVTSTGSDGGIDVAATEAKAQVKAHLMPVGRPDLQRLVGAAHDVGTRIFYSTSGYTPKAHEFAGQVGMALFNMTADLHVAPANAQAQKLVTAARRSKIRATPTDRPPSFWTGVLVQQGILAYLFIVLVAVTGPYALVQGAEAQRRLGATLTRKMPAMRLAGHAKWSALTAVLGAFGLVVMGGVVGGGLWEIAAGLERTAESGHPAGVLGGVAGFVVTGLLVRRVRVGRFQRIRLLKGLLSPR